MDSKEDNTIEQVEVAATATIPKKKRVIKKKQETTELKCRVPALRTSIKSTLWARHIHIIIEEFAPELLKSNEVIIAYNNFVDCLAKYDDKISTYIPSKRSKYESGIKYDNIIYHRYNTGDPPIIFTLASDMYRNEKLQDECKQIIEEIKKAYKPLYDLIEKDVITKVDKKVRDDEIMKQAPTLRKQIEDIQTSIIQEEERHKITIDQYQKRLSEKIEELRILLELS